MGTQLHGEAQPLMVDIPRLTSTCRPCDVSCHTSRSRRDRYRCRHRHQDQTRSPPPAFTSVCTFMSISPLGMRASACIEHAYSRKSSAPVVRLHQREDSTPPAGVSGVHLRLRTAERANSVPTFVLGCPSRAWETNRPYIHRDLAALDRARGADTQAARVRQSRETLPQLWRGLHSVHAIRYG